MAKEPTLSSADKNSASVDDDLRELIERQIGPLIGSGQRRVVVDRIQQLVYDEHFSGPIAHPRHLRAYEDIEPGAANRIITMAEISQQYAIDQGKRALEAEISDRMVGMRFGFAALLVLLACATLFGLLGNNWLAAMFLTAAALSSIGRFIDGRRQHQRP